MGLKDKKGDKSDYDKHHNSRKGNCKRSWKSH